MAAHNWRALRLRYADNGVGHPMALPSMHAVLDAAEQLGLDASVSGAKSEAQVRQAVRGYYDKLYKPDATMRAVNGGEPPPPPPGFSDEEIEASFDAFLSAGGR